MEERQDNQAQSQESKAWPKVAIIVLNWNGWRDTIEYLESVEKLTYPNYEVVIIDNGSADNSVERIKEWVLARSSLLGGKPDLDSMGVNLSAGRTRVILRSPRITLLYSEENLGFCRGNNLGMEYAFSRGADYSLVLNNDTILTADCLFPLIDTIEKHEHVGIVGGLILHDSNKSLIWHTGCKFNQYLESQLLYFGTEINGLCLPKLIQVDAVSGCMMMVPKRVFEQVGGFDERFFLWSEAWDYCLRVKKHGYPITVVTDSKIYHKVSKSQGKLSALSYYYGTRNRLLLKRLHLPLGRRIAFMGWFFTSRIFRYLQFGFAGRWDLILAGIAAIRDYFSGKVGKWERHDG